MKVSIIKVWLKRSRTFFFTILCVGLHDRRKVHVNHFCKFIGDITFGNNCNFNGMKAVGGKIVFGDNFHSGEEVMILAQSHNYEGNAIPYDSTYINRTVIIEDNVWIGSRVLICGDVHIGEGAIIAAGALITKDVPPFCIVGGVNKILKYRDITHYKEMKSKGFFH